MPRSGRTASAAIRNRGLHNLTDAKQSERLHHEVKGSVAQCLPRELHVGLSGDNDHGRVSAQRSDDRFTADRTRHVEIEQHDVRVPGSGFGECLDSGLGLTDFVALTPKELGEKLADLKLTSTTRTREADMKT